MTKRNCMWSDATWERHRHLSKPCERCGTAFHPRRWMSLGSWGRARFCSRVCANTQFKAISPEERLRRQTAPTRVCKRCKQERSRAEFSAHKKYADGLNHWCKECFKDWKVTWMERNRERVLRKNNERMKAAYRTPEGHMKAIARSRLHNAVLYGKIERKPCEVCGDERVHGHHDDYTRPLEVRWLCRKHHIDLHHGRL